MRSQIVTSLFFSLLVTFIAPSSGQDYDEDAALRYVAVSGLTYCSVEKIEAKDSFHADAIPEVEIEEVNGNLTNLLYYTAYDR